MPRRCTSADVLVLGGDLTGKAIQTIVRQPGGRWRCSFIGSQYDVEDGGELEALERLIEDHGYYPYRAEPGEVEALEAAGQVESLFTAMMETRLNTWFALADERLRPTGVPLFLMLGNDDPAELRSLLDAADVGHARRGTGRRGRRRPRDDQLGILEHHALAQPPRADGGAAGNDAPRAGFRPEGSGTRHPERACAAIRHPAG